MSVTAVRKLADLAEQIGKGAAPRQAVIASIGQDLIDKYEPALNMVLLGTYVRSEKSKGGIILGGDRTRAEDRFQGKVGLVLKIGPLVNDDKRPKVLGTPIKVGEWVTYRPSDTHEFFFIDQTTGLDGSSVRLIEDGLILGRVADPEIVF